MDLPPDTDVFTIAREVVDDIDGWKEIGESLEGGHTYIQYTDGQQIHTNHHPHKGPFAIVTAGLKLFGALFFCWAVGALSSADAYHYWGLPADTPTTDLLRTWLTWTTPCIAGLLLLAASKQVDLTQGIRQLPQMDEKAQSAAAVDKLGLVGNMMLAGGMALASGLVFRGIWLDIFAETVFVPDVTNLLDPDDPTLLRYLLVGDGDHIWSFPMAPHHPHPLTATRLARCCRPSRCHQRCL